MKEYQNSFSFNNNLLADKSPFEKLEENVKKILFGVLFVLLKSQDFSIVTDVILLIFEILQFMWFPFNSQVTLEFNFLV
jgi:hypothetical protein